LADAVTFVPAGVSRIWAIVPLSVMLPALIVTLPEMSFHLSKKYPAALIVPLTTL
jgi:hypothetical protein